MQEASQDVLKDESPKIADVREIVDRGAARVDADFARVNRSKNLQAIRERVVKLYVDHVLEGSLRGRTATAKGS
jgi:hypothetical protein